MSIDTKQKRRGRPPIDSKEVQVRMRRDLLNALDDWRAAQPDVPGRPEAIRRLIAKALG